MYFWNYIPIPIPTIYYILREKNEFESSESMHRPVISDTEFSVDFVYQDVGKWLCSYRTTLNSFRTDFGVAAAWFWKSGQDLSQQKQWGDEMDNA